MPEFISHRMYSVVNLVARCTTPATILVFRGVRISTLNNFPSVVLAQRQYSVQRQRGRDSSAITEAKENTEVSTTVFETVKETTKTAGNLGVILLGLGITGTILWAVFKELFSSNSPNNIYSSALKACENDQRIQDQLGQPIKAYGEENSRGRRKHVSHTVYEVNGRKHMLLQFYIQGTRKKGTVYVEMKQDDKGDYQRNLLVVELNDMLRTRIILEDNRQESTSQSQSHSESLPTLY